MLVVPSVVPQLVGRLSQEALMSKLPSFLPALFDAFGSQSADVRKVRVCIFNCFFVSCLYVYIIWHFCT